MAISTNTAASLIGGSVLAKGKVMKVKVIRAFCIQGKEQKVDKVIDVDKALATELIFSNKAVALDGNDKSASKKTAGNDADED
jgi:hypothetical protein